MCEESVSHGNSSSDVLPLLRPADPIFLIAQLQKGFAAVHVAASTVW